MAAAKKLSRSRVSGAGAVMARAFTAFAVSAFVACELPPAEAPLPPAGARAPTAPVHFVSKSSSGVSDSESAAEDRLGTLKVRLDALGVGIMDFWKAHGIDAKHGGIHGLHDRRGVPKEDAPKGLVQQTRHLWSFSTWYARREK